MSEYHDLKRRCRNWGAWTWCQLMADRPDGSCVNSLYDMGPPGDPDGYGVVDGNTVLAPQLHDAKPELEIDEFDAECLDCLIAQIAQGHRAALHRRYVLRTPGWSRDAIDAALRAIMAVSDENRRVVARMK